MRASNISGIMAGRSNHGPRSWLAEPSVVDIKAPTATLAMLQCVLPRDLAGMIDAYFRPHTSQPRDIIWSGYFELCEQLFDMTPAHVLKKAPNWGLRCNATLMTEACKPDMLEVMRLIKNRMDCALYDGFHMACERGHIDIIKAVIDECTSVDSNICHSIGSGLLVAIRHTQADVIDLLIPYSSAHYINQALNEACVAGNIELAHRFLILSEPRVHSHYPWPGDHAYKREKIWSSSPVESGLVSACAHGHVNIAQLMIDNGAHCFNYGLQAACHAKKSATIRLMIMCGATECNCGATLSKHER